MTIKESIDNICDILETPEYEQIKGYLSKWDGDECIGKCALGEIACRVGLKLTKEVYHVAYTSIMYNADLPRWLVDGYALPFMSRTDDTKIGMDEIDPLLTGNNIQEYIWKMNDQGYTYKQIADFLRCTFANNE